MDKNSSRKVPNKWDHGSERALFDIWAKNMGVLRRSRHNSHIISKMVAQLQEQGYNYSVLELKTKMHNLTSRYRKERKKTGTGGAASEWELFKDMDLLLAPYENCTPENRLVDSINNIKSSTQQPVVSQFFMPNVSSPTHVSTSLASLSNPLGSPSDSTPADSPDASSSTVIGSEGLDKIFKNIEIITGIIKNATERLIEIEKDKKEILKSYVEREAKVQEALIEFLRKT